MDNYDRRSVTGYVFVLTGGAILWQEAEDSCLPHELLIQSSEYMAAAAAVRGPLCLRQILSTMRRDTNELNTNSDMSLSSLAPLKNPITCLRTKHIDIMYHYARALVMRKGFMFTHVDPEEMVAGVLKLAGMQLDFCIRMMGVRGQAVGVLKVHHLSPANVWSRDISVTDDCIPPAEA